jgi:hypothetical protein
VDLQDEERCSGVIIRHKASLVAKDYVQQPGIDFDEMFALVARLETVQLLLAYAANEGWSVHYMDVKSAFLNCELQEQVFMSQLPGFIVNDAKHKVLCLNKVLYELRQAPCTWYSNLDASLEELGFQCGEIEHAVYTRGGGDRRLIAGVYVDDLIITGVNNSELMQFKEQMKNKF